VNTTSQVTNLQKLYKLTRCCKLSVSLTFSLETPAEYEQNLSFYRN